MVTGSDKEKTIEQIGEEIYSLAKRVYNCSSSQMFGKAKHTYDMITGNYQCKIYLINCLEESSFPYEQVSHIEERLGMVNFSIVGRNATLGERKLYVKHDSKRHKKEM